MTTDAEDDLAAALRDALSHEAAPELADALHAKLLEALGPDESAPAEVIVTSAPVYVWKMDVERNGQGFIQSVYLQPIARAEVSE